MFRQRNVRGGCVKSHRTRLSKGTNKSDVVAEGGGSSEPGVESYVQVRWVNPQSYKEVARRLENVNIGGSEDRVEGVLLHFKQSSTKSFVDDPYGSIPVKETPSPSTHSFRTRTSLRRSPLRRQTFWGLTDQTTRTVPSNPVIPSEGRTGTTEPVYRQRSRQGTLRDGTENRKTGGLFR